MYGTKVHSSARLWKFINVVHMGSKGHGAYTRSSVGKGIYTIMLISYKSKMSGNSTFSYVDIFYSCMYCSE